mgnify:FL=1
MGGCVIVMKFEKLYVNRIKKLSVGDKVRIKRIRINPNSSEDQVVSDNERYVGEVATVEKVCGDESGFDYMINVNLRSFNMGVFEEDIKILTED